MFIVEICTLLICKQLVFILPPTEIKWWQAWTLAVCYKVVEIPHISLVYEEVLAA